MRKTIWILILISLLLAVLMGMISVDTMHQQSNTYNTHQNLWSEPSAWLDRFISSEKYQRSIDDIKPSSAKLLISPDYSRHIWKETVERSKDFLYIWMYNISHRDSATVIKNQAKKGVSVKVILEDDKYGEDIDQEPRGWWIQVKNDKELKTNFIHAKVLVSDDYYMIQTANLTQSAFHNQREYYIIGHDKEILDNLKDLFRLDWNGNRIHHSDIHPNIIFCPTNCRDKVTKLLLWAKESIYIQNQYIEDKEIIWILQSQTETGIDVKINLPDDEKENSQDLPFIESIRFLNTPRIHAKAILIDKKYLVISSINFSQNSLDNNREIGIIVTDNESINTFLWQFNDDWNSSY